MFGQLGTYYFSAMGEATEKYILFYLFLIAYSFVKHIVLSEVDMSSFFWMVFKYLNLKGLKLENVELTANKKKKLECV